jgi:hypothetical protein
LEVIIALGIALVLGYISGVKTINYNKWVDQDEEYLETLEKKNKRYWDE